MLVGKMENSWWKPEYLTLLENKYPANWALIYVEKDRVLFSTNIGRVIIYTLRVEVDYKKDQKEARDLFRAERGWTLIGGYYNLYRLPEETNAFEVVASTKVEKPPWLKKFCFDLEYIDLDEDVEHGSPC